MAEKLDYNKIWSRNSGQDYTFDDRDYANGWKYVGSTPPSRQAFDKLQEINDLKGQDLNNRVKECEAGNKKAIALLNPRKIGITGKATGAGVAFDGTKDININVTNVSEADKATNDGDGNNITKTYLTEAKGKKLIEENSLNILKRNKAYKVGDIAYHKDLPSWAYLECTTAGTTGETEPDELKQVTSTTVGG